MSKVRYTNFFNPNSLINYTHVANILFKRLLAKNIAKMGIKKKKKKDPI